MPVNILDNYADDLARLVESVGAPTRRAIALAVCQGAVTSNLADDQVIRSALQSLQNERYGDEELMQIVQQHVDDLDDAYFEAQQAHWAGRGSEADYLEVFAKARIANAVLSALDADPFKAVTYSLYEICAALGVDYVSAVIKRVLS